MFHLDLPVLEKILRAVIVYAFLVVALRLAGKREMAQLSSADFIVLLAVANAVQNGIIGNDNSVTGGLIGATALFAVNGSLVALLFRSRRVRDVVEGSATTLVENGDFVQAAPGAPRSPVTTCSSPPGTPGCRRSRRPRASCSSQTARSWPRPRSPAPPMSVWMRSPIRSRSSPSRSAAWPTGDQLRSTRPSMSPGSTSEI